MATPSLEPTGVHSGNEKFIPFDEMHLLKNPQDGELELPAHFDILHGQLDEEDQAKKKIVAGDFGKPKSTDSDLDEFENTDIELEQKVYTALGRDQFDLALDLIKQVRDPKIFEKLIKGAVTTLVSFNYLAEAHEFAELSNDPVAKQRNLDLIDASSGEKNVVINQKSAGTEVLEEDKKEALADFSTPENQVRDEQDAVAKKNFVEPDPLDQFKTSETPVSEQKAQVTEVVEDRVATEPPVVEVVTNPEADIESRLLATRSEYAKEYSAWKTELRKSKGFWKGVMSGFGVEKKLPPKTEPEELIRAREAYVNSKKEKFTDIIEQQMVVPNQNQRPLGIFEAMADQKREDLIKAYEEESSLFFELVSSSLPDKEKGLAQRGLEWWKNLNPIKRRAISSSVIFGSTLLGGVGLYAAATYTGLRAGKSYGRSVLLNKTGASAVMGAAGTAVAQVVGGAMGTVYDKINTDKSKEAGKEYVGGITLDNFALKERQMMEFSGKLVEDKKKQLLKKALVKTAVAGATSVGIAMELGSHAGEVEHTVEDAVHTAKESILSGGGGVVNHAENLVGEEKGIKIEVLDKLPKPETPTPEVLPTQVELTSKGFIQDIHNLKASILAQYHDKPIPDALKKNILDKPSLELAKTFHFYDAEHNASGVGLKGESLGIDDSGNIVYNHLNGDKQVVFEAETGKVTPFEGKTTGALDEKITSEPTPIETHPENNTEAHTDSIAETPSSAPNATETEDASPLDINKDGYVHQGESFLLNKNETVEIHEEPQVVPVNEDVIIPGPNHIPLPDGKYIDVISKDGVSSVMYQGANIGHEQLVGSSKMLVLNDEFQDGAKYAELRNAFVKAFEKTVKAENIGPTPMAETFEGGKIYVSYHLPQDPNHVRILLNGKEIANGELVNGVPKISLNPGLKSGLFYSDNAYERAFKHINNVIKQGLKNGSVNFANH